MFTINLIDYENLVKFLDDHTKTKPIIICGKSGATGKTTLCNKLCELGYNALEISEDINNYIMWHFNDNIFIENEKYSLIILNKKLKGYR